MTFEPVADVVPREDLLRVRVRVHDRVHDRDDHHPDGAGAGDFVTVHGHAWNGLPIDGV